MIERLRYTAVTGIPRYDSSVPPICPNRYREVGSGSIRKNHRQFVSTIKYEFVISTTFPGGYNNYWTS